MVIESDDMNHINNMNNNQNLAYYAIPKEKDIQKIFVTYIQMLFLNFVCAI